MSPHALRTDRPAGVAASGASASLSSSSRPLKHARRSSKSLLAAADRTRSPSPSSPLSSPASSPAASPVAAAKHVRRSLSLKKAVVTAAAVAAAAANATANNNSNSNSNNASGSNGGSSSSLFPCSSVFPDHHDDATFLLQCDLSLGLLGPATTGTGSVTYLRLEPLSRSGSTVLTFDDASTDHSSDGIDVWEALDDAAAFAAAAITSATATNSATNSAAAAAAAASASSPASSDDYSPLNSPFFPADHHAFCFGGSSDDHLAAAHPFQTTTRSPVMVSTADPCFHFDTVAPTNTTTSGASTLAATAGSAHKLAAHPASSAVASSTSRQVSSLPGRTNPTTIATTIATTNHSHTAADIFDAAAPALHAWGAELFGADDHHHSLGHTTLFHDHDIGLDVLPAAMSDVPTFAPATSTSASAPAAASTTTTSSTAATATSTSSSSSNTTASSSSSLNGVSKHVVTTSSGGNTIANIAQSIIDDTLQAQAAAAAAAAAGSHHGGLSTSSLSSSAAAFSSSASASPSASASSSSAHKRMRDVHGNIVRRDHSHHSHSHSHHSHKDRSREQHNSLDRTDSGVSMSGDNTTTSTSSSSMGMNNVRMASLNQSSSNSSSNNNNNSSSNISSSIGISASGGAVINSSTNMPVLRAAVVQAQLAATNANVTHKDVHNAMERERRVNLRKCFDMLRVVLPTLHDAKAPSLLILKEARQTIERLIEEEHRYVHAKQELARENAALHAFIQQQQQQQQHAMKV